MNDTDKFLDSVKAESVPHIVLFWGAGCAPCNKIKPIYDDFAKANRARAKFVSIKASDNYKLAAHFKVLVVPTVIIIQPDLSHKKFVGPKTVEDLEVLLNA